MSNSDLKAVRDEILAADRRRFDTAPSNKTILAYWRGDLSGDEEDNVRELLACHPELAQAIAIPFGSDEALPHAIVDRQWTEFRARMLPTPRRFIWQASTAIAATLALTFGALFWDARNALLAPRSIVAEQLLESSSTPEARGGAATILSADTGDVVLHISLHGVPRFASYRVDIMEISGREAYRRWSVDTQTGAQEDVLRILIPGGSLKPGQYELVTYGLEDTNSKELHRHPIRVDPPS